MLSEGAQDYLGDGRDVERQAALSRAPGRLYQLLARPARMRERDLDGYQDFGLESFARRKGEVGEEPQLGRVNVRDVVLLGDAEEKG